MPDEPLRCRCDGGSYEVKKHPFLVHPDCPIHSAKAEPLHLTLEDLLLRFSDINASLRVYRGPDGGAGWFGVRNSNGVSFGPFDSWAETAPSILGVPVVARDDTAELVGALQELRARLHVQGRRPEECYEMSLIDDALARHKSDKEAQ